MVDRFVTPSRIEGYPKLMAALFAAIAAVWTALSLPDLVDPMGKPVGYDFIAFWSGGRLALDGAAASAYDPQSILAAHRLAVPGLEKLYLWHYPPTYFLVTAPLAALPYLAALVLFVGLSLWTWRALALCVAPHPRALWAALALPAGLLCLMHGQNGFLTAALFGAALLTLDKRPLLAGALIGALVIKPHLAVLFPIALAVSGRWRAFAAAGASAVALCALSIFAFGIEPWRVFFENLSRVRAYVDEGLLPWGMMPTLYVFARSLNFSPEIAMGLQLAGALGAAVVVALVWRTKAASFAARAATLAAASLLISPYLFHYDLTLAGLAIAWLAADALKTRPLGGEPATLALAWFTPLLIGPLFGLTGVQWGAFVTLALLGYGAARAQGLAAAYAPGWSAELQSSAPAREKIL